MKTKTIVYSIRFNHCRTDKDMFTTTYTVGVPFLSGGKLITPLKITFDKDGKRITTYFDDDTSHTIALTDDVEIFKKVIHAEKIQSKVK